VLAKLQVTLRPQDRPHHSAPSQQKCCRDRWRPLLAVPACSACLQALQPHSLVAKFTQTTSPKRRPKPVLTGRAGRRARAARRRSLSLEHLAQRQRVLVQRLEQLQVGAQQERPRPCARGPPVARTPHPLSQRLSKRRPRRTGMPPRCAHVIGVGAFLEVRARCAQMAGEQPGHAHPRRWRSRRPSAGTPRQSTRRRR